MLYLVLNCFKSYYCLSRVDITSIVILIYVAYCPYKFVESIMALPFRSLILYVMVDHCACST